MNQSPQTKFPREHRITQNGFSLLEALIALVVLGITLTYFITGTRTSTAGNHRADIQTRVTLSVQETMEHLYLMNISDLDNLDADAMLISRPEDAIAVRVKVRNVSPAELQFPGAQDLSTLRHVTLTATFPGEGGSAARSRRFASILYAP